MAFVIALTVLFTAACAFLLYQFRTRALAGDQEPTPAEPERDTLKAA